jgi:hypothetical protein
MRKHYIPDKLNYIWRLNGEAVLGRSWLKAVVGRLGPSGGAKARTQGVGAKVTNSCKNGDKRIRSTQ